MKKRKYHDPIRERAACRSRIFAQKKNTSVQAQLEELLKCLYESEVPEPVREYLDSRAAPAARPPPSSKTGRAAAAGGASLRVGAAFDERNGD